MSSLSTTRLTATVGAAVVGVRRDRLRGGETEFVSTDAAYDELGAADKERLASVRVLHSFEASQRLADPTPEQLAAWREKPDRVHPLVWPHRNGRRSLVIGATADHVVGGGAEDSRALLGELLDRATRPERVYRHLWDVGDLVILDKTGVMHRAGPDDPSSAREMHRTTMTGGEPVRSGLEPDADRRTEPPPRGAAMRSRP